MDRAEFFKKLPAMSHSDQQRIRYAYELAHAAHRDQTRDTGECYFQHVLGVACILIEYGHSDAHQLILGLLHDVMEKSLITFPFIEHLTDAEIAFEVLALSKSHGFEDPISGDIVRSEKLSDFMYYSGVANSTIRVIFTKLADRIHNLKTFPHPTDEKRWTQERRVEKVRETRTYIIPIAERYDPDMARKLVELCDELDATAQMIISSRPPPPRESE